MWRRARLLADDAKTDCANCANPPCRSAPRRLGADVSFLILEKLTKRFGTHLAVDGLSLGVEKGEFVSLLGPSGCGKTTTLQMIAGFVEPTAGAITLEGRDLLAVKPAKRGLGIVFQSYALFPHMTVAENVAFGLEMQGVAAVERARRVGETLELVGLAAFSGRFPRQLSGGQQQRVALARALVIRPQILLLDEPLSNLDAKLREEMQIELRQIQRTVGTTTILVTHDQAEAMALSDRIVVMNQGRAEQIGPPHEAYERPATSFVASFLGKTNLLDGATVRPEKISFTPTGLAGKVRTRIFQGNHWLYQIETPGGLVTVIRQNTGEAMPAEGDAVHLAWSSPPPHASRGEVSAQRTEGS
jgi:putative spermidine/putrescine transport system ATP-binding protein